MSTQTKPIKMPQFHTWDENPLTAWAHHVEKIKMEELKNARISCDTTKRR